MPFDRILVAIDGSEGGQHALTKAIELAKVAHGSLVALAVEGPLPAYAASIGEVDDVREQKDIFFGKVAAAAEDQADAAGVDADLVVVGHKGHFLNDYLLGSTADRVAHHAHCPVMIVK